MRYPEHRLCSHGAWGNAQTSMKPFISARADLSGFCILCPLMHCLHRFWLRKNYRWFWYLQAMLVYIQIHTGKLCLCTHKHKKPSTSLSGGWWFSACWSSRPKPRRVQNTLGNTGSAHWLHDWKSLIEIIFSQVVWYSRLWRRYPHLRRQRSRDYEDLLHNCQPAGLRIGNKHCYKRASFLW